VNEEKENIEKIVYGYDLAGVITSNGEVGISGFAA
jgi:hypothetical protein